MPVRSAAATYVGTLDGHGPESWTDTETRSFFKDPNILIPAADVTRYKEDQDQWDIFRRGRKVVYTEVVAGVTYKYNLELVFYVQPAATSLTVTATVGCLITEAGALATAATTQSLAAGVSLGKYFSVGVDSFGEAAIGEYAVTSLAADAFVETTISAGDGVWLVRSGTIAATFDDVGLTAAGELMTCAADGEFTNTAFSSYTTGEVDDRYGRQLFGIVRLDPNTAAPTTIGLLDLRLPERFPPLT